MEPCGTKVARMTFSAICKLIFIHTHLYLLLSLHSRLMSVLPPVEATPSHLCPACISSHPIAFKFTSVADTGFFPFTLCWPAASFPMPPRCHGQCSSLIFQPHLPHSPCLTVYFTHHATSCLDHLAEVTNGITLSPLCALGDFYSSQLSGCFPVIIPPLKACNSILFSEFYCVIYLCGYLPCRSGAP